VSDISDESAHIRVTGLRLQVLGYSRTRARARSHPHEVGRRNRALCYRPNNVYANVEQTISCNLKRVVQTDRQRDTQTHRAYKGVQVPPFNLTAIVGNDNMYVLYYIFCQDTDQYTFISFSENRDN